MDKDAALKWLTWLYGETFDGHVWIGGHLDGFGGRLFNGEGALTAAVDYAAMLDEAGAGLDMAGVYHRLTTMREVPSGRGKATDSITLPALMMDLDIRGPGHKADNYPESFDALCSLLADAGVPEPSTWVSSGGGWYPVWKLTEAAPVHDADVLAVMQERSRGLHRAVIAAGKALGLKVDNTSDLARVYRLPGTTNRKPGVRPVIATWGGESGRTYKAAQLDVKPVQRATEPVATAAKSMNVDKPAVDLRGGMAGLFGQGASHAADDVRAFTVTQAMDFVRPALDALRAAQDGEINVRLNDAACALAHFGAEFWGEDAADRQLYAALDATVYDGVTWRAEDTIASARRAMAGSWRGVLVPTPPSPEALDAASASVEVDAVDALIAEMVSLDELENAPPPKYMIHQFLQYDSESWLIGAPGSKKSFVAFDMAARVVRGEPWQGFDTSPADVVFVVAEGSSGHGKRVKAWRKRYGPVEAGGRQAVFTLPRPVQAKEVEKWAVLVGACRKLGQRAAEAGRGLLVVLDTQARVTVGLKENDNGEMNYFVEAVSAIRRASGACVLTIHHTKKGGGDARGASVIDGAQTTELKVMSDSGKLTAKLLTEKQKDIDERAPLNLAFEVIEVGRDEKGKPVTSLVLCEQDSTAFRLAWSGAEVTEENVDAEEQAKITPLNYRTSIDSWIVSRSPAAKWQHRIVQAVVDTAETLGLTQADVRKLVKEKYGDVDNKTWLRAWQAVTNESGQWADVVVGAGGQRWTRDPIRVAEILVE